METQALINIKLIDSNPYQPRQAMDPAAVAELAANIKKNTLLQVPSARQVGSRYQLAFGHRRLAAFQLNGEECMPLIIRDLDDLQMFEMALAENMKRRDLNPIEQANAMQRYLDEFGKTSAEAAEFFNVSPEQVRAMVRLINLTPEAQQSLVEGKISITTARTLLSMQKVASREAVAEVVKEIIGGKTKYGIEMSPDDVIDDAMQDMTDVQQLWSGEGKPRGGSHDAWLLDMKNFPNRLLPELTPVDVALALGIQDEEEILAEIDGAFASAQEWELVHESLQGRLPDRPDLLAKIEHLVNPPACTACPFHSVIQETHYCGMQICFDRKTYAWNREKLRAASKDLKIEIYNAETDGTFRVLDDSQYNGEGKKHRELFEKRHADLRLALAKDIDRKRPQFGYRGVPAGAVVMVVGKTLKKLTETGQQERKEKRSKEQAAAQLASLRATKREELDWEIAGHVMRLFDALNLVALQSLWDTPKYSPWEFNIYTIGGGRKPAEGAKQSEKEDFMRRMIAFNMVRRVTGYYGGNTILKHLDSVSEKVKSWGIKLPKSITKLAAKMDEEIDAAMAETE